MVPDYLCIPSSSPSPSFFFRLFFLWLPFRSAHLPVSLWYASFEFFSSPSLDSHKCFIVSRVGVVEALAFASLPSNAWLEEVQATLCYD